VPPLTTGKGQPPAWDLTPFYPSAAAPDCATEVAAVIAEIAELTALFDANHINHQPGEAPASASAALFDQIIARYNALLSRAYTVGIYLACALSADTTDAAAYRHLSALHQHGFTPNILVRIDGLHELSKQQLAILERQDAILTLLEAQPGA
jgi:oligoendopeptidase F